MGLGFSGSAGWGGLGLFWPEGAEREDCICSGVQRREGSKVRLTERREPPPPPPPRAPDLPSFFPSQETRRASNRTRSSRGGAERRAAASERAGVAAGSLIGSSIQVKWQRERAALPSRQRLMTLWDVPGSRWIFLSHLGRHMGSLTT